MSPPDDSPSSKQLLVSLTEMAQRFWTRGQKSGWQPAQESFALQDRTEAGLVAVHWDDVQHLAHVVQGTTVTIRAHDHVRDP